MTRKEQINLFKRAYVDLARYFENDRDWPKYVKMINGEERDHRRFTWAPGIKNALTLGQGIELFAVQTILKRLLSNSEKAWPKCWDYLGMRPSIFWACGLAKPNYMKLCELFPEERRRQLLSLSYAELNDPEVRDPQLQEVEL